MKEHGSADLEHYIVNLSNETLRTVAETAIGSPVACVAAVPNARDWPEYGVCGDKCAVSLSCTLVDGTATQIPSFVKRQSGHSGFKETPHYLYLNRLGGAVPNLYGSLLDEDQMEVLFLEDVVPNINGDRLLENVSDAYDFIGLAARLNALRPEGDYGDALYYFSRDRGIDRGMSTIEEIWTTAGEGRLGSDLREVCSSTAKGSLLDLAATLKNQVSRMERGYGHNEYLPQQVGRRPATEEMVVFDLRTTGLGPRFLDVAPWIGCPDGLGKTGLPPEDLASHYLQEYHAAGGQKVPIDTLLSETRALWQSKVIAELQWWKPAQGEAKARAMLMEQLSGVLETVR